MSENIDIMKLPEWKIFYVNVKYKYNSYKWLLTCIESEFEQETRAKKKNM